MGVLSCPEISLGVLTGVIVGQSAICADSIYTTGRAGINFYYSPNPIARIFFATSFVCGTIGAVSAATGLVPLVGGIPTLAIVSSFSARSFNRIGKYSLQMGHISNGNISNGSITNITTANQIAALMLMSS